MPPAARLPGVSPILAPSNLQLLHERAARFAAAAYDAAESTDANAAIDSQLWEAFHRSGLAMAAFPEALGGSGLSEIGRASCRERVCSVV